MTRIETIKTAVTPAAAAERYGLRVSAHGMACCPFHNDHIPSLKLYRDHYYCFGCGAHGDVIDFIAALFGLSPHEAAGKLAQDFGVMTEGSGGQTQDTELKTTKTASKAQRFPDKERLCLSALLEDLHLLQRWKRDFVPKTPDDPIDDRYAEACRRECVTEYYADILLSGSETEKRQVMQDRHGLAAGQDLSEQNRE